MTETSQASKSCVQCRTDNPAAAKFCSECGERFAVIKSPDTALESSARSLVRPGATAPLPVDPRTAFEQFLASLAAEDATSRLRSSIETSRARLKTLGVPLPKATNPILLSLMESLKALPSNEISARIAIVTALGRMGDPAVLPPLLLVTGAHSKDVRKATAIALGCIRHPLSAYLLLPMLQDGSSRVKHVAFQALIQLNQPHTVEAILAACLGSKSLRSLILETLRLVTVGNRYAFFQMLGESSVGQQPDLKIVADWLRFEFRDAINEPRPVQNKTTAAVAPQPTPETLPQTARPQQEKPVPQPVAVAADPRSSDSSVFGWGNAEKSHSTAASGTASAYRYSSRSVAAVAKDSPTPDHYEMTPDFSEDDDYESDVRLVDASNDSGADSGFFNSISEFSSHTEYHDDDDDRSELEFASNGSQASMSLSGMLAAPGIPGQSSHQMNRPAAQSFYNGNRPSESSGHPKHGSPVPGQPSFPFSAYDTATAMGNTPGLTMPLMPAMHPAAMQANGTFTPAMYPGMSTAAPAPASAFDMTASSPLIPAFTSSAGQSVAFTATTNGDGKAGSDVSSTGHQYSSASGVTNLVLPDEDEESIAEIEAAKALARAAHEKALARLSAAREEAFRKLLEDAEEIPKTLPRLLKKRISTLMSTPSTNIDRIIELLLVLGATNSPAALSTLASFSHKPAKQVREACAQAIGCIAHPGSAVLLLKLLADKSGMVAEAALKALAKIDLESTRPVLLAAGLCGTSLRTVVTAGIEATSDEKKSEWETLLLEVLRGDDTSSAAFAVSLLARIAGDTHLEIFQKLASHKAPVLRAAAVEALARTQAKRAISQINDALEDTDPTVRAQAAMSVATMYSPRSVELLQKLVFDSNLNVRRNAAQSMSRIDESDLADIIARALDQETDATTVEYLLAALQRNGASSSLPILQRYIEGDSPQFREQAVKALRKLKIPASIPVFRRLLNDHTPALRRQAIEQLAVLKSDGVLPRLREMLKQDSNETVRGACARALGDFGDETSVHLLEEALEDHPLVRLQAVIALGLLGQASAGPILLSLMRDPLPEIRYQAVRAVAQLKLEGVEEQIVPLLEDSDEMVRRGAEQSLQDLGQSIGSIRSKRLRKRFVSLASKLTPSSVAGAIPGGSKSLLILIVAVMFVGGVWGFSKLSFVMAGGESLPVGRVVSIGVSGSTKTASVLRTKGVLDVWSIGDGNLAARVRVPVTVESVISEEKGGTILLMGTELGRLDPESGFDTEKMQSLKLTKPPSSVYYHQRSNSVCIFEVTGATTVLRVIDAATLKETKTFTIKAALNGIVSPDFSLAAMLDAKGVLTLCELESGNVFSASVTQMTGQKDLGFVVSIAFTDDMKYVGFCTSTNFVALDVKNLQLVKNIPSPDTSGFVSAQAVTSTSDFQVLSGSGRVYSLSNGLQTVKESQIELSTPFTMSAMASGGDLVAMAHEDFYAFDVYGIKEQKILLTNSGEE